MAVSPPEHDIHHKHGMYRTPAFYEYQTPIEENLVQKACRFLDLLNAQEYSNPYFKDALLPHVICSLNGEVGTGIDFGLDKRRKVAKHNPDVKIELVGAWSTAYEKTNESCRS